MSGIMWSIGMNGKSGCSLQPYFSFVSFLLLLLGNADSFWISPIVRAPYFMSFIDHFIVISCRSSEGHLHHIQAYLEFAAPIPVQSAKNFKSAPKNHSIVYSISLITMLLMSFISSVISFRGSTKQL